MVTDPPAAASPSPREDSSAMWMLRGIMVGILLIGSANALSFFFRSRGWGSLLGSRDPFDEAIGFPLTIWEEANGYGSHALQAVPFLVDIAFALLIGLLIGAIAVWQKPVLNRMMDRFRGQGKKRALPMQFSLRGLMVTTVLAALAAAIARSFTPRVEILAAIYALGPIGLIGIAFLPRGLSWQQRVAVLTPAAVALIVVAIVLGHRLNVEFDKVMMGIFICWTPQSALAAIVLTGYIIYKEYRVIPRESSLSQTDIP